MPSMAAWFRLRTRDCSISWYSLSAYVSIQIPLGAGGVLVSLVSKMTFSFDANSPATVFQNVLKSEVEEMILPELCNCLASYSLSPHKLWMVLLSSVVVGVENGVSTAISDGLDSLQRR